MFDARTDTARQVKEPVQFAIGGQATWPARWSNSIFATRMAADRGLAAARYDLTMLHTGESVEMDPAEAARWHLRAADQCHVEALYILAECDLLGEGLPQNPAEAAGGIKKSVDNGHAAAQQELGMLYVFELGVPEDDIQAYKWLSLAAAVGKSSARISKCATPLDAV